MDPQDIIKQVIQVARKVGGFGLGEFTSFDRSKIEYKGVNDLVSYVDKESEGMLVEELSKIIVDSGFITEEGTEHQLDREFIWVIDPLDGTTNFVHGLPVFSVSIGLLRTHAEDREAVLGVIYDPSRDEVFYATSTSPAYCNDQQLKVSPNSSLSNGLIATGFPFTNFDQLNSYMPLLQEFISVTHGVRRMGSAAIDLAYVAAGKFDGFFEYNLNPWDVAAGALIVQRAGGTVTDFNGGDNYLFGRQIVAANSVHPEMLELIGRFF